MKEEERKLAHQRLSLLKLAEDLDNVSEACRWYGITRPQFYEYKKRYEAHGIEGLLNRPPVHKSHPMTTPEAEQEKIVATSLAHPDWGYQQIAEYLEQEGIRRSAPTIGKILARNGIRTRHDRWLKLEEIILQGEIEPSREQVEFVEERNPCFRERDRQSIRPGQLLVQRIFTCYLYAGDRDEKHLHAVVDTNSSYAFGWFCDWTWTEEGSIDVLKKRVLPFYAERGLKVENVLVSDFVARDHRYLAYLADQEIEHLSLAGKDPAHTNGFMRRFERTLDKEELFKILRRARFASEEAAQHRVDAWLASYNSDRVHEGYRNMGKTPLERVNEYLGVTCF